MDCLGRMRSLARRHTVWIAVNGKRAGAFSFKSCLCALAIRPVCSIFGLSKMQPCSCPNHHSVRNSCASFLQVQIICIGFHFYINILYRLLSCIVLAFFGFIYLFLFSNVVVKKHKQILRGYTVYHATMQPSDDIVPPLHPYLSIHCATMHPSEPLYLGCCSPPVCRYTVCRYTE